MGYYANAGGSITFDRKLNEEETKRVRDAAVYAGFEETVDVATGWPVKDATILYLSFYNKYYEEDVEEMLEAMEEISVIREGEIEFIGEDFAMWRFLYIPETKEWTQQTGHVVYEE